MAARIELDNATAQSITTFASRGCPLAIALDACEVDGALVVDANDINAIQAVFFGQEWKPSIFELGSLAGGIVKVLG